MPRLENSKSYSDAVLELIDFWQEQNKKYPRGKDVDPATHNLRELYLTAIARCISRLTGQELEAVINDLENLENIKVC